MKSQCRLQVSSSRPPRGPAESPIDAQSLTVTSTVEQARPGPPIISDGPASHVDSGKIKFSLRADSDVVQGKGPPGQSKDGDGYTFKSVATIKKEQSGHLRTKTMLKCLVLALAVGSANAFVTGPAFFTKSNGRLAPLAKAHHAVSFAKTRNLGLRMAATAPAGLDTAALTRAATEARGLAMDSIAKAHSGHLGLPLGCAEVGF